MRRQLRSLRSPLAKWGFTVLAVFAFINGLYAPALVPAVFAAYAWRGLPRRR